jgi:hypothetical protein
VAEPPIINSRLAEVLHGVNNTAVIPKRTASPVRSTPPGKRHRHEPPTSSGWSTAPQDGPILLSAAQVDNLGTCIDRDVRLLDTLGWNRFIQDRRGKSDINVAVDTIRHPARSHLRHLRRVGARAPMTTTPWSDKRIEATMARGPHKSAFEYADFLGEELLEFVLKGQWIVLPYSVVQTLPQRVRRQLRISPMGVVPQRDRRPRVIVDYSFFGVNDETAKLAPREAMQFGKALERILRQIVESNPTHGPVYLLKIDIADGFYRIWLNVNDIPSLAVSLPPLHGNTPLVALPLVLPMGWTESPPYFTTATETVADMANRRLQNHWRPPPHRLERLANTQPSALLPASGQKDTPVAVMRPTQPPRRQYKSKPVTSVDVFVDDFIGLCQGDVPKRNVVRRVLLHSLDEVFRPLEPSDNPHRKEPASEKKLLQGDGHWETRKTVLGWVIDTLAMTIELPEHRRDRLRTILASIKPTQQRTSVRKWQQLLGELRSMAIAIPGCKGLFSWMQETLRHRSADNRIRLTQSVHDCIADFVLLETDLASRPTSLYEIVPQTVPDFVGTSDACGYGMGGIAFPQPYAHARQDSHGTNGGTGSGLHGPPLRHGNPSPVLWQCKLPEDITAQLVSYDNPTGSITNSDLELMATIVHKDVLAHAFDVRERTIATGTDNTPALAWQRKGSVSTQGPAAYLLRLQALHQRFHRYNAEHFFLPGKLNSMADDASRLTHLSPTALLAHFESHYPQKLPWRLLTARPETLSSGTSALRSLRPDTALYLHEPMPTITPGACGPVSVPTWSWIPHSKPTWPIPSTSSSCLPTVTAPVLLPPVVNPSNLEQWRVPSVRWGRRWPAWGPLIHD